MGIEAGNLELKLFLSKEKLLEWGRWTGARGFVEGMKQEEELLEIVYEYSKMVYGFYDWYGKEFTGFFSKQFEEAAVCRQKVNEKIREMNGAIGLENIEYALKR